MRRFEAKRSRLEAADAFGERSAHLLGTEIAFLALAYARALCSARRAYLIIPPLFQQGKVHTHALMMKGAREPPFPLSNLLFSRKLCPGPAPAPLDSPETQSAQITNFIVQGPRSLRVRRLRPRFELSPARILKLFARLSFADIVYLRRGKADEGA